MFFNCNTWLSVQRWSLCLKGHQKRADVERSHRQGLRRAIDGGDRGLAPGGAVGRKPHLG
jgi:hypothetical protein